VRRINSYFFISLDGVVEATSGTSPTSTTRWARRSAPASRLPPDEPTVPLELLSAQTFKTGVLNLSYARAQTDEQRKETGRWQHGSW
jgi:hypothetical protein